MTEKRQPWGKWYWGDWRKDARLRRCSYAARGLWADMLSLMGGECDRFGYLAMEGQALLAGDLAGLLGGSEREVAKMLTELQGKRVFSRVGDADLEDDLLAIVSSDMPVGCIFSRRMVRDKAKEESDRANGRKGGNPTLNPDDPKSEKPDKRGVNPRDKAQSQKPEPDTSSLRLDDSARGANLFDPDGIVPKKNWDEFVKMRRKIKAPLTDHAADLIILELKKLQAAGHDPAAVIDQSTRNGWRDVFPIREQRNGTNGFGYHERNTSSVIEGTRRAVERERRRAATGGDDRGAQDRELSVSDLDAAGL